MKFTLIASILLIGFSAQAARDLKCQSVDKSRSFELQGRINDKNTIEVTSVKMNSKSINLSQKSNTTYKTEMNDNILKISVSDKKSNKTLVSLDALIDSDLADVSGALVSQGKQSQVVNCIVSDSTAAKKE